MVCPEKYVYEDVAIATYLILLTDREQPDTLPKDITFLDAGCGNALFGWILAQQGYNYIEQRYDNFSRCARDVIAMHPRCNRDASAMSPRCNHDATAMPPRCFRDVSAMPPRCNRDACT